VRLLVDLPAFSAARNLLRRPRDVGERALSVRGSIGDQCAGSQCARKAAL
jgi:hypothetical protein